MKQLLLYFGFFIAAALVLIECGRSFPTKTEKKDKILIHPAKNNFEVKSEQKSPSSQHFKISLIKNNRLPGSAYRASLQSDLLRN
jgi:hypothetical protein